jgi:GT2 family glycosyltransferase
VNLDALTAVVLNWRTADLTRRSVEALVADGLVRERIVVVDNASGDGSAERLRSALPGVHVLEIEANVGFARGNNRGAAELPGEAFLFVNSDAFVHRPGSVARLVDALDDPSVGISVPRLVNEDGTLQPSVVPISTPLPELVRASGVSRLLPNGLQPRLGTRWDHSQTRRVDAAIGAVLLVRGSTWAALEGFDEQRFMYAEDHDLFRRAAEGGWSAMFVSDAEFVHLGGASSEQRWSDPGRAEQVACAEAAMVRDHLGAFRAALTIGLMAAGVGIRAVVARLRGDRAAARGQAAWFRGYLSRS